MRQSTALKGSSSRISEMFYAGARYVSCGHSYRTYDWDAADTLVDLLLEGSEPQGWVSPQDASQVPTLPKLIAGVVRRSRHAILRTFSGIE